MKKKGRKTAANNAFVCLLIVLALANQKGKKQKSGCVRREESNQNGNGSGVCVCA